MEGGSVSSLSDRSIFWAFDSISNDILGFSEDLFKDFFSDIFCWDFLTTLFFRDFFTNYEVMEVRSPEYSNF